MERFGVDIVECLIVGIEHHILNRNIFDRHTNDILKELIEVEIIVQRFKHFTAQFLDAVNPVNGIVGQSVIVTLLADKKPPVIILLQMIRTYDLLFSILTKRMITNLQSLPIDNGIENLLVIVLVHSF